MRRRPPLGRGRSWLQPLPRERLEIQAAAAASPDSARLLLLYPSASDMNVLGTARCFVLDAFGSIPFVWACVSDEIGVRGRPVFVSYVPEREFNETTLIVIVASRPL